MNGYPLFSKNIKSIMCQANDDKRVLHGRQPMGDTFSFKGFLLLSLYFPFFYLL